ncbi:MAG: N-methylhydantoinase B [Gammaproteobacteria bacterium]|jgi:N-methylhydantoinase B
MQVNSGLSQINMQIMWNRLIAVVEEQAQTLIRTAFSATVRESGDLSAGVFNREGQMLAQAVTGTPGHVNSMANAVIHFLREIPIDTMADGDCYITNDPWFTSGHLHDVTVVTPAFYRGEAIGLFAATVHVVDVGGRGMGPDGRQVFEEGFAIPIMALARRGEMNQDLLKMIRANTREPMQVEGDLFSCAAAGDEGARRLVAMMKEFAIDDLQRLSTFIIDNSRAAMRAEIAKLPNGIYCNEMTLDGYEAPVTVKATLTIADDNMHIDYAGTSPISSYGINVVMNYTEAYTCYGVRCIVGGDIPNNFGSMSTITVSAPENCILNAQRPAPVSARQVVGHMCPDAVIGCLNQAIAGGLPAEGSMLWTPMLRGEQDHDAAPRLWELLTFNSGGMGARHDKDGLSATAFPSGVRVMPVEAVEAIAPVIYWRKDFRAGSAGAGKNRGGFGQIIEIGSAIDVPFGLNAFFDRVEHAARGRNGGGDGALGTVGLVSGQRLRTKGMQTIPAGERLRLELPGGAGHGNPFERDPQQVAEDVLDELIGIEDAFNLYGVVLATDGIVDQAATLAKRSSGDRQGS